jgi:hypothetical protein
MMPQFDQLRWLKKIPSAREQSVFFLILHNNEKLVAISKYQWQIP